jgi:purine-binding chemotaxis protein CheW
MASSDTQLKSEQILEELKQRQHTKEIVDVEEERVKVVIFNCAGSRYAFYGENIREILPVCDISWVPGLPDYLPGLINVRGDIESVVDIRYFLGEAKADPSKGLIAMAVLEDFRSGVLIDAIDDVVDIPKNAIKPPLSTLTGVAGELVAGEIEHQGTTITLLDIGKLADRVAL